MSDPLSVAGSAVGIISLGIQVCQGLISYLQAFKGQNQDIQESLNEVQTVISILYSLKDILPKVEKSSSETPAIQRCLAESEDKLREFQQFSLKLRALHLLKYRAKQTLRGTAVGIHTNVEDLGNELKVQGANVAKLSDELQLLDNSMKSCYQDLKSEICQSQLFAQEFRQEIGGKLSLIGTDFGSLISSNQRHQEDMNQCIMEAFNELKEQNNFQTELIRTTLGMDGTSIQNVGSRQSNALARTRDSKQFSNKPPGCNCKRQHEYSTFSYRFWHATFKYEEHSPGRHARSCRYFGIDQPTKRIAKAQLPLKLWSLSSRILLTSIEYSLGTATPGISVRYKSIVPKCHSPVYQVLKELFYHIGSPSTYLTATEISLGFSEAERAILSLYRDRESSPYDQDEDGKTHALLVLENTYTIFDELSYNNVAQFTVESLFLSVKRLIATLVSTADNQNGTMAIFQESISMLEIAIARSPEAVTESMNGVNTIQLCAYWPEGLRKLLSTNAVEVMDERALQLAVNVDCIESVDLLLKAGCPVDYQTTTERIFNLASERCMDVIASNLARRRSDLLSLAQQQQVTGQDLALTSDIPDDQASYLSLKSYIKEFDGLELEIAQCLFFHIGIRDTESGDACIAAWCVEVIRFLTFEALEMTHTCCESTILDRPDISSEKFDVLMNCDPGRWQKIRSDKREQENATLLETLMEEFIAYMIGMESSPRSLETFVNGYWRQRMSEIYAVDSNEMKDINSCLVGTKTHMLPDRVKPLLREGFKLIELQNLKSKSTPVGEISLDEKIESVDRSYELLPCKWCR
ncbi:hypothetical protein FNAPI_10593 [Fusarium napiforme]|uniref:Fungal N-terminal domain-containing protein n=1 Tax=Fusarium napiforme TaxID=42672 RepID=A0A8H5MTD0_9HYPO|nr:hypothetical protein FNAPI_10593 [Fusarium napiforme]